MTFSQLAAPRTSPTKLHYDNPSPSMTKLPLLQKHCSGDAVADEAVAHWSSEVPVKGRQDKQNYSSAK